MEMEPFGMSLEVILYHPDALAREDAASGYAISVLRRDGEVTTAISDPNDNTLAIPVAVGILTGAFAPLDRGLHPHRHGTPAQEKITIRFPPAYGSSPPQHQPHD